MTSKVIQCPICKKSAMYKFPEKMIVKFKEINKDIAVFVIPKGTICEHRFIIYIDRNFSVRHELPVDRLYNFGNPLKYKLEPIDSW